MERCLVDCEDEIIERLLNVSPSCLIVGNNIDLLERALVEKAKSYSRCVHTFPKELTDIADGDIVLFHGEHLKQTVAINLIVNLTNEIHNARCLAFCNWKTFSEIPNEFFSQIFIKLPVELTDMQIRALLAQTNDELLRKIKRNERIDDESDKKEAEILYCLGILSKNNDGKYQATERTLNLLEPEKNKNNMYCKLLIRLKENHQIIMYTPPIIIAILGYLVFLFLGIELWAFVVVVVGIIIVVVALGRKGVVHLVSFLAPGTTWPNPLDFLTTYLSQLIKQTQLNVSQKVVTGIVCILISILMYQPLSEYLQSWELQRRNDIEFYTKEFQNDPSFSIEVPEVIFCSRNNESGERKGSRIRIDQPSKSNVYFDLERDVVDISLDEPDTLGECNHILSPKGKECDIFFDVKCRGNRQYPMGLPITVTLTITNPVVVTETVDLRSYVSIHNQIPQWSILQEFPRINPNFLRDKQWRVKSSVVVALFIVVFQLTEVVARGWQMLYKKYITGCQLCNQDNEKLKQHQAYIDPVLPDKIILICSN